MERERRKKQTPGKVEEILFREALGQFWLTVALEARTRLEKTPGKTRKRAEEKKVRRLSQPVSCGARPGAQRRGEARKGPSE